MKEKGIIKGFVSQRMGTETLKNFHTNSVYPGQGLIKFDWRRIETPCRSMRAAERPFSPHTADCQSLSLYFWDLRMQSINVQALMRSLNALPPGEYCWY